MKTFNPTEIIGNIKRDSDDFSTILWSFTQETKDIKATWRVAISNWHGPLPVTMDELMNKTDEQMKNCRVTIHQNNHPLLTDVSVQDFGGLQQVMGMFRQRAEVAFH